MMLLAGRWLSSFPCILTCCCRRQRWCGCRTKCCCHINVVPRTVNIYKSEKWVSKSMKLSYDFLPDSTHVCFLQWTSLLSTHLWEMLRNHLYPTGGGHALIGTGYFILTASLPLCHQGSAVTCLSSHSKANCAGLMTKQCSLGRHKTRKERSQKEESCCYERSLKVFWWAYKSLLLNGCAAN